MSSVLPLVAVVLLQAPQASLVGVVREVDSGRPIEGATIAVDDSRRVTTSASDGHYVLEGVPAGPRHLDVSALGHASRIVHALVPASGTLELDIALAVEPIELAGVLVRPPAPAVSPLPVGRSGTTDRDVSLADVRAPPLLAEPDALQALGGGSVSLDPEAPSGLHVRGGAADQTVYELDGLPVFDPVHAAGLFGAWSPDALSGVSLSSSAPPPGAFDALSGIVSGRVRDAGPGFASEGTLTTTHGSVTAHGPIAGGRLGYVVSARSGFIGTLAPGGEASYLRGESGDGLLKVSGELLGGSLGLLLYSSENELGGSRVPGSPRSTGENRFEWTSATMGAVWRRADADRSVQLKAWRATSGALATWSSANGSLALDAGRSEIGAQATADAPLGAMHQTAGLRVVRVETDYAVDEALRGNLVLPAFFTESAGALGRSLDIRLGASATPALDEVYVSPHGQLRWSPIEVVSLSVAVARTHQFTQSLINSESAVQHVFPAELAVAAGSGGMPVPSADQIVLGVSWVPSTGLRLAVEGYARALDDIALVAPVETEPFSSGAFDVGAASVRGASLEAVSSGARFSWLARYGWQHVRLRSEHGGYTPSYAVGHTLDAGLETFPTGTLSLRLGLSAGWGRRATDQSAFEWESCNLLDRGCELAGSPTLDGPVGGRRLAPYVRVDAGARKHWHVRVKGRESIVALFGTLTNVLGRQNQLLRAGGAAVDMRPLSPLVVGVDWRF